MSCSGCSCLDGIFQCLIRTFSCARGGFCAEVLRIPPLAFRCLQDAAYFVVWPASSVPAGVAHSLQGFRQTCNRLDGRLYASVPVGAGPGGLTTLIFPGRCATDLIHCPGVIASCF